MLDPGGPCPLTRDGPDFDPHPAFEPGPDTGLSSDPSPTLRRVPPPGPPRTGLRDWDFLVNEG